MANGMTNMVYVSKRDIMYEKRYEKQISSPEAKARLTGKSWILYEAFLDEKRPSTRSTYIRLFLMFLEWLDYDSEQLFHEQLKKIRDTDPREGKMMKLIVSEFMDWFAETRGITDSTASNIYNCVKGFFRSNNLGFEYWVRRKHKARTYTNISREQTRKILNVIGNPKVKSYITFAKDSGLRISDLAALPIRKIRPILDDYSIQFYTFEWESIKTGEMANPVIGPDAIKYLREWIDFRVNVLGITADDDKPIFCTESNIKAFTDKLGREHMEVTKGEILDINNFSESFSYYRKKARIEPFPGETRLPVIHSYRKCFETAMSKSRVDPTWINKMTGRKGEGTRGVYNRPAEEDLIEAYRAAYPELSLTERIQVTETPGLTAIMVQMENLQNQINKLTSNQ